MTTYTCLSLHLHTEPPIFIVNYYHHIIQQRSNLEHLISLPLPTGPLLIASDFNMHSPCGSPPELTTSPWASQLECWLEHKDLMSLVPEGSLTRRGSVGRPSLINHMFVNLPFLANPFFPSLCSVSFDRSISSDHAALFIDLPLLTPPPPPPKDLGWKIEDQMKSDWMTAFAQFPIPSIIDIPSLTRASNNLIHLTHATCQKFFAKKKGGGSKGVAWWNDTCAIAAAEVSRAHSAERRRLSAVLRTTLRHTKQEWLEHIITDPTTSIWDLAKWRKGQRSLWIPPINGSANLHDIGSKFKKHFFQFPHPSSPVLDLPGNCLPQCPFYHITPREVTLALAGTSNKSAPGPSGINYKLMKWAFEAHPNLILEILNTALCLRHHSWTTAKVVIIPKPNKDDYSVAKAYRPVSLLECYGKVLEKIVANRFSSDSNLHGILPQGQFGSRPYHSATDACSLLRYKVQTMTHSGRIGGVLLFDISRFFDHLDPTFTSRVLHHLGVDDNTISWVHNFMSQRMVTMEFNNHTMDPLHPNLGTLQGSPLSPILSALVTGPILRLAELWDDSDLTLYVDDGSIFASGPTYNATADKLSKAVTKAFSWLHDSGFQIDAEKCEVMFFHPRSHMKKFYRTPPPRLEIPIEGQDMITVTPATSLRYLGVFFTPKLNWMTHVQIMSTRVLSLVKGLGVLGNSIRGFCMVNWRKIFISIILPVLTYGCQVWFRDISQITLIHTLQVAQNEACCKLAGIFHTTPTTMTHSLLTIPPIRFGLQALLCSHGQQLSTLPPSCLLHNLHKTRKTTLIPSHFPTTPLLPPITKTPPPISVFSFPNPPASPPWSHPHATFHNHSKNNTPALTVLKNLTGTTIFLASAPFHTPKVYLHIFAIYNDTSLRITDFCTASSPMHSLLLAATSSLKRVGDRPE